jgi:hypothetical protein
MIPPLAATPPTGRQQRRDDTPGFLRQLSASNQATTLFLGASGTRVAHPVRFVRQSLVKYLQEDGQPPLQEGERAVLCDADGLGVEATVVPFTTAWGERVWVAAPDEATWRDTIPQEQPPPPVEAS